MTQHYKNPLTFCAFCNKSLAKADKKYNERAGVAILCNSCEKSITRELGSGWTETDWWQEFRENYRREENQRVRDRSWSLDTMRDQEAAGYTKNIPPCYIAGTQAEAPQDKVRDIIRRLHTTYGYGYKKIAKVLNTSYKLTIGVEGVRYHLSILRNDPELTLDVGEDAKFWRDWHDELARLEREYNVKT